MKLGTFFVAVLLGLVLLAAFSALASAGGDLCQVTYRILPGDTLYRIAVRNRVSVETLARLNNIANVNRIFAGQVLCLARAADAPTTFDLAAEYTFDLSDPSADPDAGNWTLSRDRVAGIRERIPLLLDNPIKIYTDTNQLKRDSQAAQPVLWLVRPSAVMTNYTLVVFENPALLLNLQMEMTPTQTISDIIPAADPALVASGDCPGTKQPVGKLALSGKHQVELRAELVGGDGLYIPVRITQIDYHPTVATASPCYGGNPGQETGVTFALHRAGPGGESHQLYLLLTDRSVGPPKTRPQNCASWSGRGYGSRGRWSIYRCAR